MKGVGCRIFVRGGEREGLGKRERERNGETRHDQTAGRMVKERTKNGQTGAERPRRELLLMIVIITIHNYYYYGVFMTYSVLRSTREGAPRQANTK